MSLPGASPSDPLRPPLLSRRFFLRGTAFGVASMAFGGAVFGHWARRPGPGTEAAGQVLDADECAILGAVGRTFLPDDPSYPSVTQVDLVARIDKHLATVDPQDVADLKTLLKIFEYGAPVLGPSLGRFSALSDTARESYLAGWESSRLAFKRTGFHAFKYLIYLFYYDTPKTWKALGYTGPVLPRMGEEKERS